MSAKPMTRKEWLAYLEEAMNAFDWEDARESHSNTPVIDESAAKRIATALGWAPKREWVGLTDAEMKRTCYEACSYDPYTIARAIEAALRSKNT